MLWVAQTIARNPTAQFIHASYSDELALLNSSRVREIINSAAYQRLWPVKIKQDTDSKKLWRTQAGGGMKAGAAGGAITGFGAGVLTWKDGDPFDGAIILDDPLKPDDARSDVARMQVNERLNNTFKSRRNHRLVPMVLVMQRLHEEDATGFALSSKTGMEWKHLKMPALMKNGDALWPHMHTVEDLQQMQLQDRMTFASQYQQEPAPAEGAIFKAHWFGVYDQLPARKMLIHSWDTAYKANEHNDPSCCGVWELGTNGNMYLREVYNGRWEYPELKRRMLTLAAEQRPDVVLIEDKASGQSLIQELRRETSMPISAVTPDADKLTRAVAVSAIIESGKVFLPRNAPWLAEFENEILSFPNAKHDDRVDMMTQALRWYRDSASASASYTEMLNRLYR